jgi:hypothetical protein
MSELPDATIQSIYISFLFRDFLYIFDSFFTIQIDSSGTIISRDDYFYRQFIVSFLQNLEPRIYLESDGFI